MSKLKLMVLAIAAGAMLPSFADRTLNDGLVAYLPFDNSTTENAVAASPVAPETSTATAPALENNGMVGKCLNIPSGAYVKLTGSDSVTLANNSLGFEDSNRSFTAMIWVKYGNQSGDPSIFGNKTWSGGAKGVIIAGQDKNTKVKCNVGNGSARNDVYFTGEGASVWTFYAMVGNNGSFTVYHGKSDGTISSQTMSIANFTMASTYPFYIGQDGTGNYDKKFVGKVDDFALWNRALSTADIQRIYEFGRSGAGLGELLKIDANDAPEMEVAKDSETQYTFTFGGRRTETHVLCVAYGTDDGEEDKYAWDSFDKIADIPAGTTSYTYTVPDALFAINARFRFFLMQTNSLPYVKEVEYAHSDGTAWLDTGIAPRRDLIAEFDISLTDNNTEWGTGKNDTQTAIYENMFGAFCGTDKRGNYGMCRYRYSGAAENNMWDREYNSYDKAPSNVLACQFVGSCVNDTDYHVVFSTTNLVINGTAYGSGIALSSFIEGGYGIALYRNLKNGAIYDDTMIGYYKAFSLYTPKRTVRDYVPVVDSEGTVGLFDRVTGQFRSSADTAFTAGADKDATRYGWVRCVSEPHLASATIPFTATYTGGGTDPLDFADGANWNCTNAFGFALSADTIPTIDTDVTVSGTTMFQVTNGAMFACKSLKFDNAVLPDNADLRGLAFSKVTVDSVIDLQGRTLFLADETSAALGAFTITDTSQGTPGTVRVSVASGTLSNSSVALSGNLRLKKEGAGIFVPAKASQAYTGGTDVTAGTVRLGADVASCLGTGIVTVGSEATFDLNGKNASACTMILSGGTITSSANGTNSTLPLHLTLTEDSRITFQNLSATHDMYMNGSEWNLGGKTLTLKLDGKDPDFYFQQTGSGVTTSTTTTISNGTFKVEVASTALNGSNQGYHAWVHIANLNGKDGLNLDLGGSTLRMELATANSSVYGFTATPKFGDVKSTKTMEVYGTYLPASSYGFNMMMMDGSTVDLSQRTGSWNSRFSNTQDHQDKNTKVSFAANSTITVNLEGRTDLKTIAKSESPYVVTWATKPADTTEFVLDEATSQHFKCKVTDAGLRLKKTNDLVIFVK
jgi:hypothetical protein